jgi:recombination protein RecT
MPGTSLVLPDADAPLQLPPALHEGAAALYHRAERLPAWLPSGVEPAQFIMACAAEANKLPKDVNPASIVKTAFNCAVVGLIPGEALGYAFFIPYGKQCQLVIGYKGFLELAYGCGFLKSFHCDVVLKGESFRNWVDETGARIEHELPIDRDLEWRDVEAAYCLWHGVAGGRDVTVVNRKSLNKVNTGRNVWKSDPIAMALKTSLRRAAKGWRTSRQMGAAVALDGLADAKVVQPALPGTQRDTIDAEPARPRLADMAPPPEKPAEKPAEPPGDAAADRAQLLDEYLAAFNHAAASGLKARVDELADQALADDRLDLSAKDQCEKWAAEARKEAKKT